ncbi:MAG: DUF4352 domain-containing protein [Candidatus Levybacteria bacterium]|nr:DUF4352 domain-containing protein [Candidatus Levybacteria bacterium]
MKKILKWGGIIFVILIVVGVIAGSGKSNNSSSNTNNAANTASGNNQAETKTVAKLNEPVTDSDLVFTATAVDTATTLGNQYTKKDAQGMFQIITLKIDNKGKETKTVDSSMISLTDSQGRKFDRSIEGQTAKGLSQGKVDLFLQQVQPGLNVTGDIVFDVPKDATGLKLLVKGSYFGKGQEIDLGK